MQRSITSFIPLNPLNREQLAETKKALDAANEKVRTLQESISDANTTAKCAVGDLLALRETSNLKEQQLAAECTESAARIAQLQAELTKTTSELSDALHANEGLSSHLGAAEDALAEEKEGRDKDRAALVAALNGIDDLTAQVRYAVQRK
jgi:chromosome segregation ATPase